MKPHNPNGYTGKYARGFSNEKIINSVKNRFYARVLIPNENGCMEWVGKSIGHGYGLICINDEMIRAHRLSYEIHNGEIPERMHVLHKCDNRKCVAPDHLFLGTNNDNISDRMAKNRSYHPPTGSGSKNFNSKLNEKDVKKIRKMLAKGITKAEIGRQFNVTQENISFIEREITWRHIL